MIKNWHLLNTYLTSALYQESSSNTNNNDNNNKIEHVLNIYH